eukprot:CAMPEP_0170130372 /NCGR_PEP_ID=MMETSP0020_2-20130122/22548_1 /TAXON_ID=98059 /ORGANISM="Dinobryon sp., Strain UTEXLB2267" /LENGTH=2695 /DNA_ID=CAMNT_0010365113 /DNA_START=8 /DNA_END=8092 /DNA_ORIENTATION=-
MRKQAYRKTTAKEGDADEKRLKRDDYPQNTRSHRQPSKVPQDNQKSAKRDPIPENSARQIKWLMEKSKWEPSKLIYEMSGPNKDNWIKILSNPEAFDFVFSILSRKDIRDDATAAPLYLDLLTANALNSLQTYICEGALSSDKVEDILDEGRGGNEWQRCVEVANNLLLTVTVSLKYSPQAQLNSSLITLMEALKSRIDKLCPEEPPQAGIKSRVEEMGEDNSDAEEDEINYDFMEPWVNRCEMKVKLASVLQSRELRKQYTWIHETQKAARRAEKIKREAAALKDADEKSSKRNAWENAKCGVEFLNDPNHDSDFLAVKVVPSPSEILAEKPSMLPQNLVQQSHAKARGSEDEEEDMEEVYAAALSSKPIPTKFQYRSWHHYLNTHFLLLREDCLAGLRRSVKNFRDRVSALHNAPAEFRDQGNKASTKEKMKAIVRKAAEQSMHAKDEERYNMYLDVEVKSVDSINRQGLGFEVSFTIPGGKKVNWSKSSRFMNGSLLCLSSDGSFDQDTIVFGTVFKSVTVSDSSRSIPTVTIGIDRSSYSRFNAALKYTMIESPVFFEAYRPVLVKLQMLASVNCTLSDVLIGRTRNVGHPAYFVNSLSKTKSPAFAQFAHFEEVERTQGWKLLRDWNSVQAIPQYKVWNPLENERFPSFPSLDEAQQKAIALALTKKLALIQGPPGCGKTFVGVIITRILLANRGMRANRPILFVCQTNHALDQILEHVYKFEKQIIRIGSRSESEIMQSLTLQAATAACEQRTRRTHEEFNARDELKIQAAKLKSNIAQQGAVTVQANLTFDVNAPFWDTNLARLWKLLKGINQEKMIEMIFDASPNQISVYNLVRKEIESRLKASHDKVPSWLDTFDKWMDLPIKRRILLVAAYSPSASKKSINWKQVVNLWVDHKPDKKNGIVTSIVSNHAEDSSSKKLSKDNISTLNMYEEEDDDFEDRNLDDDCYFDDDYFGREFSEVDIFPHMLRDENFTAKAVWSNDTNVQDLITEIPDRLRNLSIVGDIQDPFKLLPNDRMALMEFWAHLLFNDSLMKSDSAIERYHRALAVESRYSSRVDAEVMRNAAVIGMTTNGAAKFSETLSQLGCEVLIVEEAAEVLEAPILAALTQSTEHAILIGDHQQLRPQVNEYNLAQRNKLEISLFERLINAGLPHVTLNTQRRMHPEVSSLITPFIYRKLNDDPSVLSREKVRGIKQRVFFFQHTFPEDAQSNSIEAADAGGKSNTFEAKMVVATAQHLLNNGYTHDQIVILTMYKSQVRIIKSEASSVANLGSIHNERVNSIRVTTTDNYQGEESDIVLLSLVRSNKENKAGFVKIPNRVCVALSRARCGLYVFGNFEMIRSSSSLWDDICNFVDSRQQLGSSLQLQCENHPNEKGTEVFCVEDFRHSPNGGCMRPCQGLFPVCSHPCELLCHPMSHDGIICNHICEKPRPPNCTHSCLKPCGVDCGPCSVRVIRVRNQCGHSLTVFCGDDVEDAKCTNPCSTTQLCGHPCREQCHHNHPPNYKCRDPCQRTKMTCSHPCPKKCFEPCGPCQYVVTRSLPCGHVVDIACSIDITTYQCNQPCTRKLTCGHNCSNKCSDVCVKVCEIKVKKAMPLCKKVVPHEMNIKCYEVVPNAPCSVRCNEKLPCGHMCNNRCGDCLTGTNTVSQHQPCALKCNKRLMCNHLCNNRHSCSTECPPCDRPCKIRCSHRSCNRICGAPCSPCEAKCELSCPHVLCCKSCNDPHSVQFDSNVCIEISSAIEPQSADFPYCMESCKKILSCNHACLGLCGERCPGLCADCKPLEVQNVLGKRIKKAELKKYRYVILACDHSFEVNNLLESIQSQLEFPQHFLKCPHHSCLEPLQGVYRFDHFFKQSVEQLKESFLKQRYEFLMKEYESDLDCQFTNAVIDRLEAKLSSSLNPLFSEERPMIEMFLGKALMKVGRLREADERLQSAFNNLVDNRSKASVAHMRGLIAMKDAKTFESAVLYFEVAVNFDPNKSEYVASFEEARKSFEGVNYSRQVAAEKQAAILKVREHAAELKRAAELAKQELQIENRENADEFEPVMARTAQDLNEIRRSGCGAIHLAALRGRVEVIADLLLQDKSCGTQLDNGRNTALHWAVRIRNIESVENLHDFVPWHIRNTNRDSFLDLVLKPSTPEDEFYYYIRHLVDEIVKDPNADATKRWTCFRSLEKWSSDAMDELMNLTGLRKVKSEAIKLFCSVQEDMKRPEKARMSTKAMYHFAFVGNPGVGKTTVAKLFADILVELGLRGNNFVSTTGQKLIDLGSTKFSALLKSATPGVLFIDEVYQLDPKSNRDGMSIVNELLDATERDREKLTVIIGGYKDDVLEKFFATNKGLPSRFTTIVDFENFTIEELRSIFLNMVEGRAWKLQKPGKGYSDIATIVAKRLHRGSNSKGYANARSVRNYVEQSIGRANERMVKENTKGIRLSDEERVTVKRVDVLGEEFVPENCEILQELNAMLGLNAVKEGVHSLAEMVKQNRKSEEAGEDVIDIVLHRVFLGNPGTGKTSIAKVYGRLLKEMGYLSNGDVIVVGASKLTGDVIGSSAKKTNELLDSAAGKVLVIDEAYVLANSTYGKEALDVLVERIQGGPGEDIAVILCGYEEEMRKMMRDCNPGLNRRFRMEDAFRFEDYSDEELVIIMQQRAHGMGLYVSEEIARSVVKKVIAKQRAKPNFGNVGAVNNLLDRGKERCM